MDPLSIATAAASTIAVLYKATEKCGTFLRDSKIIDEVLLAFRSDFSALILILETIKSALRKPRQLIIASVDGNQTFLNIVHAAIQECHDTAEGLEHSLKAIEQGNVSKSLIARSIRQVRFMNMNNDFRKRQSRLKAQKANLQLLLQMLNVSIAQYPTAVLRETITPRVSNPETMLRNTLLESHGERDAPQGLLRLESSEKPVLTQKQVNSPTSGIASFSSDNQHPTNGDNSVTEYMSFFDDSAWEDITPQQDTNFDADDGIDSDEEREVEHTLTAYSKGRALYDRKLYVEAEYLLQSCLRTAAGIRCQRVDVETIESIQLCLAETYMYREKWGDAMEILHHLTAEVHPSHSDVNLHPNSLFALARVYLANREMNSAIVTCKEALSGYKKTMGKSQAPYVEASHFLIISYALVGDLTAIEVYGKSIPKESYLDAEKLPVILKEFDTFIDTESQINTTPLDDWLLRRGVALTHAAEKNLLDHVKILYCLGADVNFKNRWGRTPLGLAANSKNSDVEKYLRQKGGSLDIERHPK